MSGNPTWRMIANTGNASLQRFLSSHEPSTTVMSEKYRSGYLDRKLKRGGRFYAYGDRALIYHGPGGFFYPIGIQPDAPEEETLRRFFGTFIRLYSIMGQRNDVDALARCFAGSPGFSVDYYLLRRDQTQVIAPPPSPGQNIDVRSPSPTEWKKLLPLQIAYEVEEVLLPGHRANPATSKATLTESLKKQIVLVAYHRGEAIARVATNAQGYQTAQIGGVYTDPAWRGRGLARWLMSKLIDTLTENGKNASLFVKEANVAALRLYDGLGFSFESNFRISYYV